MNKIKIAKNLIKIAKQILSFKPYDINNINDIQISQIQNVANIISKYRLNGFSKFQYINYESENPTYISTSKNTKYDILITLQWFTKQGKFNIMVEDFNYDHLSFNIKNKSQKLETLSYQSNELDDIFNWLDNNEDKISLMVDETKKRENII